MAQIGKISAQVKVFVFIKSRQNGLAIRNSFGSPRGSASLSHAAVWYEFAMLQHIKTGLVHCCSRPILTSSIKVALVVGTILNIINQGERIFMGGDLHWGKLPVELSGSVFRRKLRRGALAARNFDVGRIRQIRCTVRGPPSAFLRRMAHARCLLCALRSALFRYVVDPRQARLTARR